MTNYDKYIKIFEATKFAKGGGLAFECSDYEGMYKELQAIFIVAIADRDKFWKKKIKEIYTHEINYWKDIFDNRPKDRDLESDNIAQNFARIEIERLQKLLAKINSNE